MRRSRTADWRGPWPTCARCGANLNPDRARKIKGHYYGKDCARALAFDRAGAALALGREQAAGEGGR